VTETDKDAERQASERMTEMIEKTLASARVPRETRGRVANMIESSMKDNLSMVRDYTSAHAQRATEMMEMYASGKSLVEIAQTFNVTRQRVHQILVSAFGDYRDETTRAAHAQRREIEKLQARDEWDKTYGDRIVDLISQGFDDHGISKELGVSKTKVVSFRRRRRVYRSRNHYTWDDKTLLDFLTQAEREIGEGGVSIKAYTAWRNAKNSDDYPSYMTFIVRYGSFVEACDLAGVSNTGRVLKNRRSDYITTESCAETMRHFVDWAINNNETPNSGSYERYRNVTPSAPSLAIMIRRLGSFPAAVEAAMG